MRKLRLLALASLLFADVGLAQTSTGSGIYSYTHSQAGISRGTLDQAEADMRVWNSGEFAEFDLSFPFYNLTSASGWTFSTGLDYRPFGGLSAVPPPANLQSGVAFTQSVVTLEDYVPPSGKTIVNNTQPPPTADCPSQEGDPCVLGYGNQYQSETDLTYGKLSFTRYYNSQRTSKPYAAIDANWSHSFASRVLTGALVIGHMPAPSPSSDFVVIQDERAHVEFFRLVTAGNANTPGVFRSTVTTGKVLTVSTDANGKYTWIVYHPDGHQQQFDHDGRLVKVYFPGDPARTQTLTYVLSTSLDTTVQDYWLLNTVTDGNGRGFSFTYARTTNPHNPYRRLTSVVSKNMGVGANPLTLLTFDYDSNNNLWKVHRKDGTVREYKYGEQDHFADPLMTMPHTLTGVIDEKGNRYADFGYDRRGRAVYSHQAGNADMVSMAYASDTSVSASRAAGESVTYTFPDPATDRTFRRPMSRTETATGNLSGPGRTETWVYGYQDATCANQDERLCRHTDLNGVVTQYEYDTFFERARIEGLGTPDERRIETDYDPSLYRVSERRIRNKINNVWTTTSRIVLVYGAAFPAANGNPAGPTVLRAKCEIDARDATASGYACSATIDPPANTSGVRRTVFNYCGEAGSGYWGCPEAGWLQSVKDPRGNLTTYSYYRTPTFFGDCSLIVESSSCFEKGDIYTVTNAAGQITRWENYSASGMPMRIVETNQTANAMVTAATNMIYDGRDRLLERKVSNLYDGVFAPAATKFTYNEVGDVLTSTDADGVKLTYTYDDAHRVTDITDLLGNKIHYSLDTNGNRTREDTLDANGVLKRTLSRSYDLFNRLWTTTDALNHTTSRVYSAYNQVIDTTDAKSVVKHAEYDGLGRLKASIQGYNSIDLSQTPQQNVKTQYKYDDRNNLVQVIDPDNLSTTYTYTGLGNLTNLQSPDTGTTAYTYDKGGNRLTQTDARNILASYGYDSLNRLSTITYPTTSLNVGFFYDEPNANTGCTNAQTAPIGRLTRMTDSSGSTAFCYDAQGRVRTKTQVTSGKTFPVVYTYSPAGRPLSITYPSGVKVTYSYDTVGRAAGAVYRDTANTDTTLVSTTTYYPFGPVATVKNGMLKTVTRTYDQNYAFETISGDTVGGLKVAYTEDSVGNITKITDWAGGKNPAYVAYSYDPLQRLVDTYNKNNLGQTFEYNATGDRTLLANATVNLSEFVDYTYQPGTHRLSATGTQGYTLDAAGNTTSRRGGTYTYDDRGRMSSVVLPSGETYKYLLNARGERVAKQKWVGGNIVATTYYVYDEAGLLLGEYDANGARVAEYFYFNGVLHYVATPSGNYYVETDHLGSPRKLWSPTSQTYVWNWEILDSNNAFGAVAANQDVDGNGVSVTMNLRFPGQYYDVETGLHYNYFRDYEPGTGRYVESDPIGLAAGPSTYTYVTANPLGKLDLYGLQGCKECGVYRCSARLGDPTKPPVFMCPARHYYSCSEINGQKVCKGMIPTSYGGDAEIVDESYLPALCSKTSKDCCYAKCLRRRWANPPGNYYTSGMCIGYDADINRACQLECDLRSYD